MDLTLIRLIQLWFYIHVKVLEKNDDVLIKTLLLYNYLSGKENASWNLTCDPL